jgi:small subunit ribosomal protein S1
VEGKITQVTSYGANVELEAGVSGVVHLSEIDWEYVEKPSEIFKKFMVLPLKVIKIDEDAHLIFLSRKRTLPNPWDDIDNFYKIDSIVKGKVIRVREFGAFVKLDKGIEGFVPVSEIDWERIKHPSEKLKKDKEYEFKIIKIDKEKLQMTLSISHKKIDSPGSVLSVGEEVSTLVIKLDSRRKKISLSIKRAEKEEQKRFMKEYNKKQSVDKILFKDLFGDLFTKK